MPANNSNKTVTMALDAELYAALVDYGNVNCPGAPLGVVAREVMARVLRGEVESAPAMTSSVRQETMRETRQWMHDRVRKFLADLAEESERIGPPAE